MMRTLIVIGTAVLLSATVSVAQQRGHAGACTADIKEKCAGVERGEGRISACVKEHLTEFSKSCQDRLAKVAATGKACRSDVKQSCEGKKRGRGRLVACLREALGNLSDPCKDALAEAVAGRRR
jgi:hypothetical protein